MLTDYTHERLPSLSLANAMEICAYYLIGFITGDEGQALDCPAVLTDYIHDRLPSLSLANTMEICAFLKGTGN